MKTEYLLWSDIFNRYVLYSVTGTKQKEFKMELLIWNCLYGQLYHRIRLWKCTISVIDSSVNKRETQNSRFTSISKIAGRKTQQQARSYLRIGLTYQHSFLFILENWSCFIVVAVFFVIIQSPKFILSDFVKNGIFCKFYWLPHLCDVCWGLLGGWRPPAG